MKEAAVFDTHAYVKKLKTVGFTEEQAEVQSEALSELIEEGLAAKRDLKVLDVVLKKDLKDLETKLEVKIESIKSESIKWSFLFWMGQLAAMIALFKFFLTK